MPHNFFHLDPEQMAVAMAGLDDDAAERRLRRRLEQEQRLVADEFPTGLHGRLAIYPHIRLSGNRPTGSTYNASMPSAAFFFGHLEARGVFVSDLTEPLSLADQHERDEVVIRGFPGPSNWPSSDAQGDIGDLELEVRSSPSFELWFGEVLGDGAPTFQVLIGLRRISGFPSVLVHVGRSWQATIDFPIQGPDVRFLSFVIERVDAFSNRIFLRLGGPGGLLALTQVDIYKL